MFIFLENPQNENVFIHKASGKAKKSEAKHTEKL